jgi:hypothetical protein
MFVILCIISIAFISVNGMESGNEMFLPPINGPSDLWTHDKIELNLPLEEPKVEFNGNPIPNNPVVPENLQQSSGSLLNPKAKYPGWNVDVHLDNMGHSG